MDNQFKDLQDHYVSVDDFKRKAITLLAEGRERLKLSPFDEIEFFESDSTLEYIAVGKYDEVVAALCAAKPGKNNKAPAKDKAKKDGIKNSK